MACYISAGHHLKDPGAIANGLQENQLTIRVRDRVVELLKHLGATVYQDKDTETLAEYLKRIQPGEGSVVVEFHFDAGGTSASGSTAFYADSAHQHSINLGHDLALDCATALGIPMRGAHSESESHRGRLGLVHEAGICALLEIAFITNREDMANFDAHFEVLCQDLASTIYYYDRLIA